MSIALMFPGQGSQSVGMMNGLATEYRLVPECFAEAGEALGLDLWALVQQGPAETLNATEFTQPALLAAGVATWRVWRALGGAEPAVVSGHSLGEFTALVCAGSIDFAEALRLVRLRGQLMQAAVDPGAGAMAAILGSDDATVEAVCAEAAQGSVVEAVNFNAPGQVVIAGERAAVERAMGLARARGAKRAMPLPVSVPAHSALMRPAALELEIALAQVRVREPRYRYVSASDVHEHHVPADIRATLVRQLISPVRWVETVHAAFRHAGTLIECGPGKVLQGLNRRIEPGAQCFALDGPERLQEALAAVHVAPARVANAGH